MYKPQRGLSRGGRRSQQWPGRLTLCHRQKQSRKVEQQTNKENATDTRVNSWRRSYFMIKTDAGLYLFLLCFSPCQQERQRQRREGLYMCSESCLTSTQTVYRSLPPVQRMTFVVTAILRARLLFNTISSHTFYVWGGKFRNLVIFIYLAHFASFVHIRQKLIQNMLNVI